MGGSDLSPKSRKETSLDDRFGLAEKIRQRDQETIRRVVETYGDQIFRAARGAGFDRQEAEEVTQATFLTFVESAPRFEGRAHVRTWLFGILYRKVAEARRQLGREREMDDVDDVLESRFDENGIWIHPPRPADELVFDHEVRDRLAACLETTPPRQRMAFVLREVMGLSTDEVLEALEVSRTNLGVMLHRVKNRLRDCLVAKGI